MMDVAHAMVVMRTSHLGPLRTGVLAGPAHAGVAVKAMT